MESNTKIGDYRNQPYQIKDHKQRGQWVELLFMARAAQYGLGIAKPLGDWEYYDAAVHHQGRFRSVQVKSTTYCRHHSYCCNVLKGRKHTRYPRSQVNFFAFYLIPIDLWYIMPSSVVGPTRQSINFSPDLEGHRYEGYKEAWHLLFRAASSRSRQILTPGRRWLSVGPV
jgi:PD-(D/E)XK nuclease superfamily protein